LTVLGLERQRRLLQMVRANGSGNVLDLAGALGVSPSTVRRDLREMNERGLLTRVHGGASLLDNDLEPVLVSRAAEHGAQKRRIGQAAAARVPDGATILITGGSTTEAMVPFLVGHQGLTVVTNGLGIAYQLARHQHVSVVVLGGVLRHEELSLLGPVVERALSDFHVDIAISGAFGVHPVAGVSGADVTEADTDRRMLHAADQLFVLADSSKFARRGPMRLVGTERISCLFTDDAAPAATVDALRARGVDVVLC
jgi:DeoR/GlpR family transcriptional regulator of sugar metabolism